jgi:bacillithiol biosynthesis cysteine-adding enzyme BshC
VTLQFETQPLSAPSAAPDWPALAASRPGKVAAALEPAFHAVGEPAQANLRRLLAGEALCVTTGQQPGLLTGPLYTIYKALSAAAFAQRASLKLGRPVVPVFWVAGDDHDFAEGNHLSQLNRAGEVEQVVLRERAPDAPLTPLYHEPLGDDIRRVIEAVLAAAPDTEFRPAVSAWLERHYRPDATMAAAFRDALAELLGSHGVVLFDPTAAAAKRAMAPLLVRALEGAADLDQSLARRAAERSAKGHATPVAVGEGATLVMIEGALGRDRLTSDGGAFVSRRSGERWTLAQLQDVAAKSPQRLSPNVLLRPAVEAALLPTLAYVAGPGELGYLPQCEPIYQALGIVPQQPVGRWSAVLIEARVRKLLDRYGLTPASLERPEGQLEAQLVKDDVPAEATEALAALRREIEAQYARLGEAAVAVDPTLKKPVESARNGALTGLADIERKLVAHLKQKNDVLIGQITKARNTLFPRGQPQERVFNVVSFLLRYGPEFLTSARDAAVAHVVALEADASGA